MAYGDKKMQGGRASAHPDELPFPVLAAPTTDGKSSNHIREELISVACWKLDDVRFAFNSSFVLPQAKPEFAELAVLRTAFPGAPLSLFGHADPVGDDAYNKALSGRRVRAIYAILIRDAAMWEKMYTSSDGTSDTWGLAQSQSMLKAIGFDPGNEAGSKTAQSTQAVKDFQTKNGLTADGDPGQKTRAALIPQYFQFLSNVSLTKADFLLRGADAGGKGDYQGCSEFNPLMMFSAAENTTLSQPANQSKRNQENAVNRRVLALLFRPGIAIPVEKWPCPRSTEGTAGCVKRFWSDAAKRRSFQAERREFIATKDTFACRFYQRLTETSPCEGVPPVLLKADPLIFVARPAIPAAAPAAAGSGAAAAAAPVPAPAPAADTTPDPVLGPGDLVVVVKREGIAYKRVALKLTTDIPFDGTGLFERSDANIEFFRKGSATALKFDGKENQFTGAELAPPGGVELEAEGKTASTKAKEITLTLTLSGGSVVAGPPSKAKATSVEVKLDICEPRIDAATDPVILPTLATGAPAPAAGAAKDKFFLGRPLPLQTDPKIDERAMLIVQPVKPADFTGKLILKTEDDKIVLFVDEEAKTGEVARVLPEEIDIGGIPAAGMKLFVEGAKPGGAARDTSVILGVKNVTEIADHVKITVCHTEICSNKKPADLKLVAQVPEKPERKTKSTFVPAPLIIGNKYDVEMRPFIEIAVPSAFEWKTAAAEVTLKDTAKEVVGCKGKSLSTKLRDVRLELFLTTDIGKLKKRHELTVVNVEINPVIFNDSLTSTDDINFIKNPAGCVMLSGANAGSATQVPKYEITKIEPNLTWTDDDGRIAWWIVGGEAKADEKYDGAADFRNDDTAKYGTKIQVFGKTLGDVLIQPYSGGYGYGMFRAHVIPIQQVKYRVNRIITNARPAHPAIAAQPEQLPQDAFPGNGAVAAQPAVPHLPAVDARPAQTKLDAHAPTTSVAEIQTHFAIVNIYLRQAGIEMIPDDSAEVASAARPARVALPAVVAQAAIAAQVATPALPGPPPVAAQTAVPARPAIPALPAVTARPATVVNNKVGQPGLDAFVESITQVAPGIFDVEVNVQSLTFQASDPRSLDAIRINARNEIVTFAYIESQATAGALATAKLCPVNHAPLARADPPRAYTKATYTLTDKSSPSSSLIPKTGIPADVPVDAVQMVVLFPDVSWQGSSPATRDIDLLWGVIVPTSTIDTSPAAPITVDKIRLAYGNTMAHELGHVFGLGHRGGGGVPDGLMIPAGENLMHPSNPPPQAQDIDIIQVKAMRFSEAFFRTP